MAGAEERAFAKRQRENKPQNCEPPDHYRWASDYLWVWKGNGCKEKTCKTSTPLLYTGLTHYACWNWASNLTFQIRRSKILFLLKGLFFQNGFFISFSSISSCLIGTNSIVINSAYWANQAFTFSSYTYDGNVQNWSSWKIKINR